MKNAIIILSDPKSGSDEALTRMFNALAMADECKREGDELEIVFAGAGTRWPAELNQLAHPAHARYDRVRDHVAGASRACAAFNQATVGVETAGLRLLDDNAAPGGIGGVSLRRYYAEGWNVTVF